MSSLMKHGATLSSSAIYHSYSTWLRFYLRRLGCSHMMYDDVSEHTKSKEIKKLKKKGKGKRNVVIIICNCKEHHSNERMNTSATSSVIIIHGSFQMCLLNLFTWQSILRIDLCVRDLKSESVSFFFFLLCKQSRKLFTSSLLTLSIDKNVEQMLRLCRTM